MDSSKIKDLLKGKKSYLKLVSVVITVVNVIISPGILLAIIYGISNESTKADYGVFSALYFLSILILLTTFFKPSNLKYVFINYFLLFLVIANSMNPLSIDIFYDNKNSWGKPDEKKNHLRDDIESFLIKSKTRIGEAGQQMLTNRAS